MAEYTWSDIISDPTSYRAKKAVGKEVYYGDTPSEVLLDAKANLNIGVLLNIDLDEIYPFKVKSELDDSDDYGVIIPKEEEPKPEYVPFESMEEFIEAYDNHTYPDKNSKINTVLCRFVAYKHKERKACFGTSSCYTGFIGITWNGVIFLCRASWVLYLS